MVSYEKQGYRFASSLWPLWNPQDFNGQCMLHQRPDLYVMPVYNNCHILYLQMLYVIWIMANNHFVAAFHSPHMTTYSPVRLFLTPRLVSRKSLATHGVSTGRKAIRTATTHAEQHDATSGRRRFRRPQQRLATAAPIESQKSNTADSQTQYTSVDEGRLVEGFLNTMRMLPTSVAIVTASPADSGERRGARNEDVFLRQTKTLRKKCDKILAEAIRLLRVPGRKAQKSEPSIHQSAELRTGDDIDTRLKVVRGGIEALRGVKVLRDLWEVQRRFERRSETCGGDNAARDEKLARAGLQAVRGILRIVMENIPNTEVVATKDTTLDQLLASIRSLGQEFSEKPAHPLPSLNPNESSTTDQNPKHAYSGLVIGSLTSLSRKPPTITFNVNKTSSVLAAIKSSRKFLIHTLHTRPASISLAHAHSSKTRDIQAGTKISYGAYSRGLPTAFAAPAVKQVMFCELCKEEPVDGLVEVGDHVIVVARVVGIETPKVIASGRAWRGPDKRVDESHGLWYVDRHYRGAAPVIHVDAAKDTRLRPGLAHAVRRPLRTTQQSSDEMIAQEEAPRKGGDVSSLEVNDEYVSALQPNSEMPIEPQAGVQSEEDVSEESTDALSKDSELEKWDAIAALIKANTAKKR